MVPLSGQLSPHCNSPLALGNQYYLSLGKVSTWLTNTSTLCQPMSRPIKKYNNSDKYFQMFSMHAGLFYYVEFNQADCFIFKCNKLILKRQKVHRIVARSATDK